MSKRIDRINNFRYPISQSTVFDEEELTVLELVSKIAYKINETVGEVNSWFDYLDIFVEAFDKNLQGKVIKTLTEWQDSGLLDVIIDEALQTQMDVLEDETHTKLNLFENRLAEIAINVDRYGAKGDGVTDDTFAIQEAFNSGYRKIEFTNGKTYNVSDDIWIKSETEIDGKGATIRYTNDTTTSYHMLKVYNESNIIIKNLTLKGNRVTSNALGQGHLLAIGGSLIKSKNIRIENVYMEDSSGDGIYITEGSSNINISKCETNLAYRNGISIIDGQNVTIADSEFHHTVSTLPGYGIDLEPNYANQIINNITITNCKFYNNTGVCDIGLMGMFTVNNQANISIIGCNFDDFNRMAISVIGYAKNTYGVIDIKGNTVVGKPFLQLRETSKLIKKRIRDNFIQDWSNSTDIVYGGGIQVFRELKDNYEIGQLGNYEITNNTMVTVNKNPVVGISIFDNKLFHFDNVLVKNNTLKDNSGSVTNFINYNNINNYYNNSDMDNSDSKLIKEYSELHNVGIGVSVTIKSIQDLITSGVNFESLVIAEIKGVDSKGLTIGVLSKTNLGELSYTNLVKTSASWSVDFLIESGVFKIKNNTQSSRVWLINAYVESGKNSDLRNPSFFTSLINQLNPINSGTTEQRPSSNRLIGQQYYDTTLGKPIWWNSSVWKDSDGTTV